MEQKMEIVRWLDSHGYHFFDETPEHFASRFSLEILKYFKECFAKQKNIEED